MLKVLVLGMELKTIKDLYYYMHKNKDIELEFLICRSSSMSFKLFFASLLWQYFNSKNGYKILIPWLLLKGKLHIIPKDSHSPEVLSLLKRKKYDIGLNGIYVIYKKHFIDCFRLGILNSHPSLLPKYRGRTPVEWAILNDDEVGITVFFIDEGIDTGKRIILQRKYDVSMFGQLRDIKKFIYSEKDRLYSSALVKLIKDENYFITKKGKFKLYSCMPEWLRDKVKYMVYANYVKRNI